MAASFASSRARCICICSHDFPSKYRLTVSSLWLGRCGFGTKGRLFPHPALHTDLLSLYGFATLFYFALKKSLILFHSTFSVFSEERPDSSHGRQLQPVTKCHDFTPFHFNLKLPSISSASGLRDPYHLQ